MSDVRRSASWSAFRGTGRTHLRTTGERRPPRHLWDQSDPRPFLWQLTTRPPRCGRSGSQLPGESRFEMLGQAGRTAVRGRWVELDGW
jgi:hypothetical protein